jgi:hypothetical protein
LGKVVAELKRAKMRELRWKVFSLPLVIEWEPLCRRLSSLNRACCPLMMPELSVILNGAVSAYELTSKIFKAAFQ